MTDVISIYLALHELDKVASVILRLNLATEEQTRDILPVIVQERQN